MHPLIWLGAYVFAVAAVLGVLDWLYMRRLVVALRNHCQDVDEACRLLNSFLAGTADRDDYFRARRFLSEHFAHQLDERE